MSQANCIIICCQCWKAFLPDFVLYYKLATLIYVKVLLYCMFGTGAARYPPLWEQSPIIMGEGVKCTETFTKYTGWFVIFLRWNKVNNKVTSQILGFSFPDLQNKFSLLRFVDLGSDVTVDQKQVWSTIPCFVEI